jgi:hypothetical protein
VLDVPRNHVAEERALANPAFSEDRDVLAACVSRNTEDVAGVEGVVCFVNVRGSTRFDKTAARFGTGLGGAKIDL